MIYVFRRKNERKAGDKTIVKTVRHFVRHIVSTMTINELQMTDKSSFLPVVSLRPVLFRHSFEVYFKWDRRLFRDEFFGLFRGQDLDGPIGIQDEYAVLFKPAAPSRVNHVMDIGTAHGDRDRVRSRTPAVDVPEKEIGGHRKNMIRFFGCRAEKKLLKELSLLHHLTDQIADRQFLQRLRVFFRGGLVHRFSQHGQMGCAFGGNDHPFIVSRTEIDEKKPRERHDQEDDTNLPEAEVMKLELTFPIHRHLPF